MKILIVGAGFGGLALAAYLRRDGHVVTIVEKSKDRKYQGFVIGLWGNGIHALEPFGVVERIWRLSIPVTISLETWYRGRVALLGDAAHAVSPTAAPGGAMALEDAHVLAEELRQVEIRPCDAGEPDKSTLYSASSSAQQGRKGVVEEALANYVSRRKPRVAKVHHTSDFLIWLVSMNYPAMTFVRNTIMHLIPSSYLLRGMEPILETEV